MLVTWDDLNIQSAYYSEHSWQCHIFVTLFSNGRVYLCKLDHTNPQPSQCLNNTLNTLLPNSNKSLMEVHTIQTLPLLQTYTHQSKPPEGEFNGFSRLRLLSTDRLNSLVHSWCHPCCFFFFFALVQTCGRAGCGRLCRSLLSGQSHI